MRNPRPRCPNPDCEHHRTPVAGFYRKKGYRRTVHNHQPVPRYQCKACGRYFCATQTKAIAGQHRPDLNQQIFNLAVSGCSMNRMIVLLGCSERTIAAKIKYLAGEARRLHTERLATLKTSYVMVDELETFVHARLKQLSVTIVLRVKTGEVLGFGVAKKPSNSQKGWIKYGWHVDQRRRVFFRVLTAIRPLLKPQSTVVSDAHPSYPKWLQQALPGVQHRAHTAVKGPGFDPLFTINHAFAKMRNDLARLGRKTWTTTKTIEGLENHLWLWVAWNNGYPLK